MPLKALTEADRDRILPWRNAPEVRQYMYTQHEISPEEHRAWFERMRSDPRSRWYIYIDRANAQQGVVYFTSLDPEQATAFWGFYARPGAPAGAGMRMEFDALDHAFGTLGVEKLSCEVLETNKVVINLHKKCGFTHEGTFRAQFFDGEVRWDILRLGLLAKEWAIHRERVRERIEQLDTHAASRNYAPPRDE